MLELLNKINDSLLVYSDFSKKDSQTRLHAEKETG